MANRINNWWRKLSYRNRCTVHALCGAAATPFVVFHLRPTFDPFIIRGGYIAGFAWIGLIAMYYVTARSWIDLITDAVDVARNEYSLKGGDIAKVAPSRISTGPYYDILNAPDIKRDWSLWQYVLACWTFVESVPLMVVVPIALFLTMTQSPYIDASSGYFSPRGCSGAYFSCSFRFLMALSYCLTEFSVLSIIRRVTAGVMPLPLRWLGLPNWYPGQNVWPRWLNELMIKLFRTPV